MSDFEDGEILSDGDDARDGMGEGRGDAGEGDEEAATTYTPLPRPTPAAAAATSSTLTPRGSSSGLSALGAIPRPRSSTNSSMMVNVGDADCLDEFSVATFDSFASSSNANDGVDDGRNSSEDDEDEESSGSSSSDSDCGFKLVDTSATKKKRKRKKLKLLPKMELAADGDNARDGGGVTFQRMATEFQQDRERQGLPTRAKGRTNNVWGSILQEESLNREMNAVGVGRSLRDVESDRGAETYDYVRAQEIEAKRREQRDREEREREEKGLDDELQSYWAGKSEAAAEGGGGEEMETDERRQGAIQAGRKRSVRDRLGARQQQRDARCGRRDHRMDSGDLEEMSIPPPGKPRSIADVESENRHCASDVDLGREMAAKLSEPKTQLIVGVVELVGREIALELFDKTRQTEAEGGMMIKNGERRRTPGGVFLQLLRDVAAEDARIDENKVRHFFAQCNRPQQARGRRRPKGPFRAELELFKKLSQAKKKKEEQQAEVDMADESKEEEEEELKPLPDILTCITQRFQGAGKGEASDGASEKQSDSDAGRLNEDDDDVEEGQIVKGKKPEPFVEPEAPPNSVERIERTINAYDDDDFLNHDGEDIDLY